MQEGLAIRDITVARPQQREISHMFVGRYDTEQIPLLEKVNSLNRFILLHIFKLMYLMLLLPILMMTQYSSIQGHHHHRMHERVRMFHGDGQNVLVVDCSMVGD